MKLVFSAAAALLLLSACGDNRQVCPTGWEEKDQSAGGCEAPLSYTDTVGTGVYGFVRTTAHGGNKLVVGAQVFALPGDVANCDAPSANPNVLTTTTDDNGIFTFVLAPGDYFITSGEVPECKAVHVDANTATDVALTSP